MNRDGQRRKQITSGNPLVARALFSPDGKWIAYAAYLKGSYATLLSGSSECYVVDVTNPAEVRHVGQNRPLLWIDNQSFLSWRDSTFSGWQTFIDGREQKKLSPDSTLAVPLHFANQFLINDYRHASQGLFIGSVDGLQQPLSQKLRLIQSFKPSWRNWTVVLSPDRTFALLYNSQLEFWKIKLPSGSKERMQRTFPELAFGLVHVSNDGKSIVYAGRLQTKSKLVLIENPFE
jgi:hypothetical protein